MDTQLPDVETFTYDKYLSVEEERERFTYEWAQGLHPREVPVLMFPEWEMWNDDTCRDRELFLLWNLWGMATSAEHKSDGVFPYLTPWYGAGLMASGFGAKYYWLGNSAPQTHPIFKSADEVKDTWRRTSSSM